MRTFSLLLLLFSVARSSYVHNDNCTPKSVAESLTSTDVAILAYVDMEVKGDDTASQYFRAKVRRVYNGCGIEKRDRVFIDAPWGIELHAHTKHVLFGSLTEGHIPGYSNKQLILTISSCEANKQFHRLSWSDRRKLRRFQSTGCHVPAPEKIFGGGVTETKYDGSTTITQGAAYTDPVPERIFGEGVPEASTPYSAHSDATPERIFGEGVPEATPYSEHSYTDQAPERIFGEGVPEANPYSAHTYTDPLPNPGRIFGQGVPEAEPEPGYGTESTTAYGEAPKAGYDQVPAYNSYSSCSRYDCGPLPYDSVSQLCPDRETTSGITGNCVQNPATYKCEWEIQACPTCSSDLGCRADQICVDGFCAPAECLADSECPGGDQFCEAGRCKTCHCDAGTPLSLCPDKLTMGGGHGDECLYVDGSCKREYVDCPKCLDDAGCKSDQICHDGFCHPAQCGADEHCSDDEVCTYGRCEKCQCGAKRTPYDCHNLFGQGDVAGRCLRVGPGGQCDFEYSQCDDCYSDDDCHLLGNNGICVDGQCASAQCLSDSHCEYNEVCENYECLPCYCGDPDRQEHQCHDLLGMGNSVLDCYRAPDGQCVFEYSQCDDCYSDDDCHLLGNNGICVDGQCASAQCLSDSHCEYNEVCENYECLPCYCGDPDRQEHQCHDLLGMGNSVLDCYRAPDGQCVFEYSKCDACAADEDCYKLENGYCDNGKCASAQCFADSECGYNEVCENYECLPCYCGEPDRQEHQCHDLLGMGNSVLDCYRAPDGQCVFEYSKCDACAADEDCYKLENGYCDNGKCASAQCFADHECRSDEVCQNYECVPCDCGQPDRQEFQCHDLSGRGNVPETCSRSVETGQCAFKYSQCEQCHKDADCFRLGEYGICDSGKCALAECLVDEHCGHDELCVENQCVQCDCGYNADKKEHKCHDNVNYGNVPGPCLRENGKCVQEFSTCDVCRSDADCSQVFNGVCRGGTCESAECLLDNQCNEYQQCDAGYCVACDCGDPAQKDTHCSDGKSIAGADKCVNKNGHCTWTYTKCPVCDVDYTCPYGFTCEYGECIKAPTKCNHSYDCPYGAPYCLKGYCSEVGCRYDNDCHRNEICNGGHCKRSNVY